MARGAGSSAVFQFHPSDAKRALPPAHQRFPTYTRHGSNSFGTPDRDYSSFESNRYGASAEHLVHSAAEGGRAVHNAGRFHRRHYPDELSAALWTARGSGLLFLLVPSRVLAPRDSAGEVRPAHLAPKLVQLPRRRGAHAALCVCDPSDSSHRPSDGGGHRLRGLAEPANFWLATARAQRGCHRCDTRLQSVRVVSQDGAAPHAACPCSHLPFPSPDRVSCLQFLGRRSLDLGDPDGGEQHRDLAATHPDLVVRIRICFQHLGAGVPARWIAGPDAPRLHI
mmetsp:Transcript_24055/g.50470  ORF Transcript_24055/g.50470 Transcript_24055/m.50470 type:complete len:281 (+) Transcript_24055:499-1341(+)